MSTDTTVADTALVDELVDEFLAAFPPKTTDKRAFLGEQFDRGLAWLHFPKGCGGLNLAPGLHAHAQRRILAAGAPNPAYDNVIGYGMIAPTIAVHGTEAQKSRYLRPLFTCEEIWCQLFSEPGSGSDVAGLSTRAVRDGDVWRLDGQKVWTTLAHISSFGLVVARTDPDQPKHNGLTAFLIDMHQPGVEVRPLYQITGEAEFNEVFMTDAVVPDSERIGDVGDGWRVAITTLMNERVAIGGGAGARGSGPIGDAMRMWNEHWAGVDSPEAVVLKDRLVAAWVRAETIRLTNLRAADSRRSGTPGPEGSVGKLASAEFNKQVYELCMDLRGAPSLLYSSDYPRVRPSHAGIGTTDISKAFLRMRANSIEGGTSEVMRNILAERVLGLPADPKADKGLAWKDIPRN